MEGEEHGFECIICWDLLVQPICRKLLPFSIRHYSHCCQVVIPGTWKWYVHKGSPLPVGYGGIWAPIDQLSRVAHPFDFAHISFTMASSIIISWSFTNSWKRFLTSSMVKYRLWTPWLTLNGEIAEFDGHNFKMPKVPTAMTLQITYILLLFLILWKAQRNLSWISGWVLYNLLSSSMRRTTFIGQAFT